MSPQIDSDRNGDYSDGSDIAYDDALSVSKEAQPKAPKQDSDEDDDYDEDQYVVETIVGHKGQGKNVKYMIKWHGYPSSENTFEPLRNLLPDARNVLAQYHEKIGFDPAQPQNSKGVKRAMSKGDLKNSDSDSLATKKSRTSVAPSVEDDGWTPKITNWEEHIDRIDHIDRDPVTEALIVYIRWKDQRKPKTRVSMDLVYKHCPVAMCKFYENHLKFTVD